MKRFRQHRLSHPQGRGVEVHQPGAAGADDHSEASRGRSLPGLTRATSKPYRLTPDCHLMVFVNGRFQVALRISTGCPTGTRVVDLARRRRGRSASLDRTAGGRRRACRPHLGGSQHRAHAGRRRGPSWPRRRDRSGAAAVRRAARRRSRRLFHLRNLIRRRSGIERHGGRDLCRPGRRRLLDQRGDPDRRRPERGACATTSCRPKDESAFHVAETSVRLEHQAAYRMFAASLGAELGRNEVDVDLAATDAVARLAGATLARDAQHLDTTIRDRTFHAARHQQPGVQERGRWARARRLPGPHPRSAGRAEDRCPAGQPQPAPVGHAPPPTPSRNWRSSPTT